MGLRERLLAGRGWSSVPWEGLDKLTLQHGIPSLPIKTSTLSPLLSKSQFPALSLFPHVQDTFFLLGFPITLCKFLH